MTLETLLDTKRGRVVGIANEHSIAAARAPAFRAAGVKLAVTHADEKSGPNVEPLKAKLGAPIFLPLDVEKEGVFDTIDAEWSKLDLLLHSIVSCPKDDLHGPVSECSKDGFAQAMDISVHSQIRMPRLTVPLMPDGGSILTMSYCGADKVVDHFTIMGPVKTALESTMRYLAAELGLTCIRVDAISHGPLRTRAGSGIDHFDAPIDAVVAAAVLRAR